MIDSYTRTFLFISELVRPFTCPNENCNKSYKRIHHLRSHVKYECNIMPRFSCPFCNKKCARKTNLKRHVIAMHTQDTSDL